MTRRGATFLLAIAILGACAPVPQRPSRAQIDQALARAASQVRSCYRAPRVSFRGRQIVTRLRVRFTPEGQLATMPIVMFQDGVTEENEAYAGRMAQAAIEAVMRCTPLRLPPALYQDGWSAFELTFSHTAVA